MLEMLINIRNICCHDDKLYGFIHNKVHIMNIPYHNCFNLKKNVFGEYLQVKKDLIASLICIKYFVDKGIYNKLIDNISNLIEEYSQRIDGISKKELLQYMFLPEDFANLKDL